MEEENGNVKRIQCYVSVDPEGNIIDAEFGENIIPSRGPYFFFWVDHYLEIEEWQVVVDRMIPKLVKKEV